VSTDAALTPAVLATASVATYPLDAASLPPESHLHIATFEAVPSTIGF